jgi:hypothetical protein
MLRLPLFGAMHGRLGQPTQLRCSRGNTRCVFAVMEASLIGLKSLFLEARPPPPPERRCRIRHGAECLLRGIRSECKGAQ